MRMHIFTSNTEYLCYLSHTTRWVSVPEYVIKIETTDVRACNDALQTQISILP